MPEQQQPGFKPGTPLSAGEARKLAAEMTTQIMCAALSGGGGEGGSQAPGSAPEETIVPAFKAVHAAIMACLALPLEQT
jgi:hypothetical protein